MKEMDLLTLAYEKPKLPSLARDLDRGLTKSAGVCFPAPTPGS